MPVSLGPDFFCDQNAARESWDILQRANIICSLRNSGLGKEIKAASSYVPFLSPVVLLNLASVADMFSLSEGQSCSLWQLGELPGGYCSPCRAHWSKTMTLNPIFTSDIKQNPEYWAQYLPLASLNRLEQSNHIFIHSLKNICNEEAVSFSFLPFSIHSCVKCIFTTLGKSLKMYIWKRKINSTKDCGNEETFSTGINKIQQ